MDIREADDETLMNEIKNRGITSSFFIRTFSDTELNNEISRRMHEAEKRYEEMMAQGLV